MKLLAPLHWKPSPRTQKTLTILVWILGIAAIFWICTFKIMDRDFWWHITAGKIFLQTHAMIVTDPFAYARAGLPYLATHEWLAQIILFLIYRTGGYVGIILFRGIIATTCVGLLLLLTKHKRVAYLGLALWAIVITKGSFLERPQLFTFVLFAAFLLLAFRFLDADSHRTQRRLCAAFIGLELLWVNMHGGAALLGCAIVTFLLLQTVVRAIPRYTRPENLRTVWLLVGTLVLMSLSLVSPPNGFGTITYITQLLSDKTIAFIAEWQPREWPLYLQELWPFFVLSITALLLGKKHWVFNTLLLLMTAYLSRQAFRHEILFVLTSIATCFYQCDRSERMARVWRWIGDRPVGAGIITVLIVLLLGRVAYQRSFGFERQDNLFGFGQFDLARGAMDFVEREKISGNMFNTYGIGGYLIYRGYPDRKVFIDGRNVDYGFEYMARAYAAGLNAERWEELAHLHDITYAIVDYDAIKLHDQLPYSSVLDVHPEWALVYLDDWTAVYLKKTPQNQPTIDRFRYEYVNATQLQFNNDFADAGNDILPHIIEELQRIQSDNPEGIKATMALAKIALRENRLDDAMSLVRAARSIRPKDPEPLAILAGIHMKNQNFAEAANAFSELLILAGDNYPDLNYAFIADTFEKAGHPWKAWYYRLGSPQSSSLQPSTGSGTLSTSEPALSVNPALDAQKYSDEGLAHAEAERFDEAEESFRTSLMMNPGNPETWNNLCALLLQMKRAKEAMEACVKATDINGDYGDAHFNLALAYYQSGMLKDARTEAMLAKKLGLVTEADKLLLLIDR